MWDRKILKSNAKIVFKSSYLKSVIVCLIFFIISGWQGKITFTTTIFQNTIGGVQFESILNRLIRNDFKDLIRYSGNIEKVVYDEAADVFLAFMPVILILIAIAMTGALFAILINMFIIWPLSVGKFRFFMELREGKDSLDNLLIGYKNGGIKNIGITFLFKVIYTFLWSMLFVIPGIIKTYEYRMIPYILCENPDISRKRAFEISKKMMKGNKWKTFVLDLSFIGWLILSSFTFGILNILYVNPYIESTNAELYSVLREKALKNGYASSSELLGF